MTHKQIEASREARLWIGQVIVPAITAAALVMSKPEARDYVTNKASAIKEKIKTAFCKK